MQSGRAGRASTLAGQVAIARFAAQLLRFDPSQAIWIPIEGDGLPTDEGGFYFLAADDLHEPPIVYAATDKGVHASWDAGAHWLPVSQGLPAQSHPSTLRYTVEPGGNRVLSLFTFGRSAWRARLG